uniref:Uncharacterized protein n=1 Tax=Amphimedon queenslandica TaxID=400682 RepID=A0A1X7SW27_AMPQE
DQSRQICNALATVTAAILACPDRSNHLWYHLFSPDKLSGTQVTGFLLNSVIKEGRLYDCGVVLDEEGEYGRPEYLHRAERGILNLHSLYLLLWCNFGTLCMNLLTQRDSNIKGTVISSYQAVRHYCKSQLSLMWLHMTTNIALTDEQLSLLVVCSMKRMIQNSYQRPTGLLHELEKRDEYEKVWHAQIFVPSLKEVENNFASYLSKLKADDLVAKLNLRELSCSYPHVPTLQQFTHFVQRHCASSEHRGKYDVLVKLTNSYSRLQSYSALLPSLIEFYQWIVTDLSHDLTQEESTEMGICSAVKYASEKYSKDVEKNYTKLFERVQNDYNEYLKVIDFSIGAGACANVQRKNEVPLMNDAVKVFRFLPGGTSDETEEQTDYLFLVIQDIVNFHNNFLREINELIKHNDNLKKYLSTLSDEENADFAIPRVHPLAVNEYSCILGHNVSNRRSLLELVHKHQTETGYDLNKIQEEVVVHFIAGKLPIDDCQTKLKLQFHYKVMRTEQSKMQHPAELMLTLDQLNEEDMK